MALQNTLILAFNHYYNFITFISNKYDQQISNQTLLAKINRKGIFRNSLGP